jgi:hypothetical protein
VELVGTKGAQGVQRRPAAAGVVEARVAEFLEATDGRGLLFDHVARLRLERARSVAALLDHRESPTRVARLLGVPVDEVLAMHRQAAQAPTARKPAREVRVR